MIRTVGAIVFGIVLGCLAAGALCSLAGPLSFLNSAAWMAALVGAWAVGGFVASAIATKGARRGPLPGIAAAVLPATGLSFFLMGFEFPLAIIIGGPAFLMIAALAAALIFARTEDSDLNARGAAWAIAGTLAVMAGLASWGAWYLGYFPHRVDDLTFVSLERVQQKDSRDNLRLTFRSSTNLRAMAKHSGAYGAYARISLCPFHANPWVSIGRVNHNGVDLGTKPTSSCVWREGKFAGCQTMYDTPAVRAEMAFEASTQGPFYYQVYFTYFEQWIDYKNLGTTSRRFPLPWPPQDLCVRVHGDGGPPGLQTNELVVPRSAIMRALGDFQPPPLAPARWQSDPGSLRCDPAGIRIGQPVVLQLGPKHGWELAVHRLPDDAWFMLITSSPPKELQPLLTEREYGAARRLVLRADVEGYKWWAADGHMERVFSKPGEYVVYSAQNVEDVQHPGFGCVVTLKN